MVFRYHHFSVGCVFNENLNFPTTNERLTDLRIVIKVKGHIGYVPSNDTWSIICDMFAATPSGFQNSPVTKLCILSLAAASVIASILGLKHYFVLQLVPQIWGWGMLIVSLFFKYVSNYPVLIK